MIDLVQKIGHPHTVRRASIGQFGGKDFAGVAVDRQVEFPPNPSLWRLSQVSDMDPETRAVDEEVDRFICDMSPESEVPELLEASGESRVIGDRKVSVKELSEGPEEPLGLAEREAEDHADRQGSLDGQVRVGPLTAGPTGSRGTPGRERSIRKPDGQVTTIS